MGPQRGGVWLNMAWTVVALEQSKQKKLFEASPNNEDLVPRRDASSDIRTEVWGSVSYSKNEAGGGPFFASVSAIPSPH